MDLLQNPLFLLSTLFSLFYAWQALQLGRELWRRRAEFRQEPLLPWKKTAAERAAFLLAIPPGVLVHELGHALAVWLYGGRVVGFGYWLYWGYVVPSGRFPAGQEWFIAIAGTLGTLAYAAGLALARQWVAGGPADYFLQRAFRFQMYYALIYYPIFTAVTFIGDWRIIYDFQATPLLSGATAVVHAGLLLIFWQADRRGAFEQPAFASLAEQQAAQEWQAKAEANPLDREARLRHIDDLRVGGANNRARQELAHFLADHPDSPEAHLQLGALLTSGRQQVPRRAAHHFERALTLGLENPIAAAVAHKQLGDFELGRDRVQPALNHFQDGLAAIRTAGDGDGEAGRLAAHLHYLQGTALRRLGQPEAAAASLETAVRLAEVAGDQSLADYYRQALLPPRPSR